MGKIDVRKLSTETRQQFRDQAIRLRKAGKKPEEITEFIGVHHTIICRWYKTRLRDGSKTIQIKKRGQLKGIGRTLTPEQDKILQKRMKDKCPEQMKLPFMLWTRITVQQLTKVLRGTIC
jgi:transposase